MSEAARRFFDFLHEHKDSARIVSHYQAFIDLATALMHAEKCGFILDPDSVEEACERTLREG